MRRGGCICCRRAAGSRRTPYSFRFCMFLGLHSFLRMFSFVPHGVRHGWRFLGDGLAGRGRPFFFFLLVQRGFGFGSVGSVGRLGNCWLGGGGIHTYIHTYGAMATGPTSLSGGGGAFSSFIPSHFFLDTPLHQTETHTRILLVAVLGIQVIERDQSEIGFILGFGVLFYVPD